MRLPDFTSFKPLEENRERMKAERSKQSFVQIDERLSVNDLNYQPPPPPPPRKPVARRPRTAAPQAAAPVARPKPVAAPVYQVAPVKFPLLKTLALFQLVITVNAVIAYLVLPHTKLYARIMDSQSEYVVIGTPRTIMGFEQPNTISRKVPRPAPAPPPQ